MIRNSSITCQVPDTLGNVKVNVILHGEEAPHIGHSAFVCGTDFIEDLLASKGQGNADNSTLNIRQPYL